MSERSKPKSSTESDADAVDADAGGDPSTFATAFGARVRALRIELGLSQAALAEKAELSLGAIGSIERGTRFPRRDSIEKLHKAFASEPDAIADALLRVGEPDARPPRAPRSVRALVELVAPQPAHLRRLILKLAHAVIEAEARRPGR